MLLSVTQSDGNPGKITSQVGNSRSPGKITSQVGNSRSPLRVIHMGGPCSVGYPTATTIYN
jgi:hypothetical protein